MQTASDGGRDLLCVGSPKGRRRNANPRFRAAGDERDMTAEHLLWS